ncbi:MAG: hypothetical protein ACRDOZ_14685 [Nocardioides sp.]
MTATPRERGHPMHPLTATIACWYAVLGAPRVRDDRGDVPGWVLVTVMTAGLVAVIWGVADDQLLDLLRSALNSVRG